MERNSVANILIHNMQKEALKGNDYANATMKTIQFKIIKTKNSFLINHMHEINAPYFPFLQNC